MSAEAAAPIKKDERTNEKERLSRIEFVIAKNKRIAKIKGTACCSESNLFLDNIEEAKIITAKIPIGRFKGLLVATIFFSTKIFIVQIVKRIMSATITSNCFGIMKKSVVAVRKKRGNRNNVIDITTLDRVSKDRFCRLFIRKSVNLHFNRDFYQMSILF